MAGELDGVILGDGSRGMEGPPKGLVGAYERSLGGRGAPGTLLGRGRVEAWWAIF